MSETNSPGAGSDPDRHHRACAYDAIHLRLFGLRTGLVLLLLFLFYASGASSRLADGLLSRFDPYPWMATAGYLALCMFGYWALFFPVDQYQGYTLEHRFGLSHQTYGAWCLDHMKSLVLEVLFGTLLVSILYAWMRGFPQTWWVWSSLTYGGVSLLVATILPIWVLPLFYSLDPLEDSDMVDDITEFMQAEGVGIVGIYRWGLEDKTAATNAALVGLGRTRRIILGDTLLRDYSREEILAVLAHEVGHYKHRDMVRMLWVSTFLAAAGLWLTHLVMQALLPLLSATGMADLGVFPVVALVLYGWSLAAMPLVNFVSRTFEFAADAFAVQRMQSAGPLVSALEKLAVQNLTRRDPARWVETLLHSHPSIARRVDHAGQVERRLGAA